MKKDRHFFSLPNEKPFNPRTFYSKARTSWSSIVKYFVSSNELFFSSSFHVSAVTTKYGGFNARGNEQQPRGHGFDVRSTEAKGADKTRRLSWEKQHVLLEIEQQEDNGHNISGRTIHSATWVSKR